MKYKFFSLFILIGSLILSTQAKALTTVVTVGDSITWGSVSGDGPNIPYVTSLGTLLGSEYNIINVGCGASFSLLWIPLAPRAMCEFIHPTTINLYVDRILPIPVANVVTILIGTNDAGIMVSAESYRNNLMLLINELLFVKNVETIILMTPPPRPEEGSMEAGDPIYTAALLQYKDVIFDICATTQKVYCIDLYTPFNENILTYFYEGDIHPNQAGHDAIAQLLHDKIVAVPEPNSLTLMLSGLIGLFFISKRSGRPTAGVTGLRNQDV